MPQVVPFLAGVFGATAPAIGTAAFGAWTAGVGAGSFLTTTLVGRLLSTVALTALSRALQPKPQATLAGIRTEHTMTGGTTPASFVLGRYATEGQLVAPPMSHGQDGGTPNAWLNYVIELGDIPGQSLESVMIDGEPVTLGASAHAEYGLPVEGRHAGHAWVKYHDGTQTSADPMLLARYGADPDRPWTADMIGAGIPHAICTFRLKRDLYSGFPRVRFVIGGIPLYDPRKDTSVGGSGAQRWTDRATWDASENPAVQAYNIFRGIALPGGDVWGGGMAAADLPLDNWFAAMNAADAAVALAGGGTEPAWRASYEVLVADEPAAVIEELLKACSGQVCEVGGLWKIRIGGPGLPVLFFSDDDVNISESQSFEPFPGVGGTYNGAHASYPDPGALWQSMDAPPRYNATYEAQDGDRRLVADLTLPAAPYPAQVQRIMRACVEEERRMRRHSLTLAPEAIVLEPLDCVAWTSGRNGYVAKDFEVSAIVDPLVLSKPQVSLRERDPADYDWTPDFELPVSLPSLAIRTPEPCEIFSWSLSATSVRDGAGAARRPAILFAWSTELDDIADVAHEVRLAADGSPVAAGSFGDFAAGSAIVSAGILATTTYEARLRPIPAGRRAGQWTAWTSVTTGDLRLGAEDVAPGAIPWSRLGADVQAAIDSAGDANASAATALAAQQEAETARDLAGSARDDAQAAVTAAEGAATQAGTARSLAETARGLAETARTAAEAAQSGAELAQGVAVGAVMATLPDTFEDHDAWWSDGFNDPIGAAGVTHADAWPVDGGRTCLEFNADAGGPKTVVTAMGGAAVSGGRWTTMARVKQVSGVLNRSTLSVICRSLTAAPAMVSNSPVAVTFPSLDTWVEVQADLNLPATLTTEVYIRGGVQTAIGNPADVFRIQWIKLLDVTQGANAADSASAAHDHAVSAGASATAAGTAASAAQTERLAAASARGGAETAATNAVISETSAAGSASAAASSATLAANSATAAGSSASAAAGSASLASTKATEAATSATSAQASFVNAEAAFQSTRGIRRDLLPSSFADDGDYWTTGYNTAPDSAPPLVAGNEWSFVDDGGARCVQFVADGTGDTGLAQFGVLVTETGRSYRITVEIKQTAGTVATDGVRLYIRRRNDGFTAYQDYSVTLLPVTTLNQWETFAVEVTDSGYAYKALRSILHFRQSTDLVAGDAFRVRAIRIDDITESKAAGESAFAAAGHADTASSHADEAGASATAASASATAANTSAGTAATSASQASASKTSAAGSASSAAGSATLAASSAAEAGTSASAANTSAGSAASSATAASTSASAANTAKLAAQSAQGSAETAQTAAASSATTASGSANAAATSAALAVKAQVAAFNHSIVTNGTFETDISKWVSPVRLAPAWNAATDTDKKPTVGSLDLAVTDTSNTGYHYQQDYLAVDAPPGSTWRVSFWAKKGGSNTGTVHRIAVGIQFFDETDVARAYTFGFQTLTGAWQLFTGDIVPGAYAIKRIRAYIATDNTNAGTNVGDIYRVSDILIRNVTAEKTAEGHASAANTSAATAATQAGNAATSANAANTSKLAAEAAYGSAIQTVLSGLPSDFTGPQALWTGSLTTPPASPEDIAPWSLVDDATWGKVAEIAPAGLGTYEYLMSSAVFKPVVGRRYRLTIFAWAHGALTPGASGHLALFFRRLNADYSYAGNTDGFANKTLTAGTWAEYATDCTCTVDVPYWRYGLYSRNDLAGSNKIKVAWIKAEDITESAAAGGFAAEAEQSRNDAVAAKTSAENAESSAVSAKTLAVAVETRQNLSPGVSNPGFEQGANLQAGVPAGWIGGAHSATAFSGGALCHYTAASLVNTGGAWASQVSFGADGADAGRWWYIGKRFRSVPGQTWDVNYRAWMNQTTPGSTYQSVGSTCFGEDDTYVHVLWHDADGDLLSEDVSNTVGYQHANSNAWTTPPAQAFLFHNTGLYTAPANAAFVEIRIVAGDADGASIGNASLKAYDSFVGNASAIIDDVEIRSPNGGVYEVTEAEWNGNLYRVAAGISETNALIARGNAEDAAAGAAFARDVAARVMTGGQSPNPIFALPDTSPTAAPSFYTWASGSGATIARGYSADPSFAKYGHYVQYATGAVLSASLPYIYMTGLQANVDGLDASDVEAVEIDLEVEMVSGTWGSAMVRVQWYGGTGGTSKQVDTFLQDVITARNGKVQSVQALVQRPSGYVAGASDDLRVLFYGNVNGSTKGETDHVGRIHRFDYRIVSQSASALVSQKAITDLQGKAQASLVLRAKAGGGTGAVEIVAADDPVGGPSSKVKMTATEIEFEGEVISSGNIRSSNYAESAGVPTAGFKLQLDGTLKAVNIIATNAIQDNAVTKVRRATATGTPSISFITDDTATEITVLLFTDIQTLGVGAATYTRKLTVQGTDRGAISVSRADLSPGQSSGYQQGTICWKDSIAANTAVTITSPTTGSGSTNSNVLICIETRK